MAITDKPVIVIAGPTASGKSATALLICEALDGEIISADSMQIYRGMDIGTAKASSSERQKILHHMLDILEPGERYSVADYKRDATTAIHSIQERGKQPVLCGGTGQYLSAMIEGISFSDQAPDEALRAALNDEADRKGIENLYDRLAVFDPESADRIAPGDRKRIIRALEVYHQTGLTISQQNLLSRQKGPDFSYQIFGLSHDRPVLYDRINRRVDDMIAAGLADEVQNLLEKGLDPDCTCLQAIGYKELLPCLSGEQTMDMAADAIRQATRRYAKRQMTWFRKIRGMDWLMNNSPEENAKIILQNI